MPLRFFIDFSRDTFVDFLLSFFWEYLLDSAKSSSRYSSWNSVRKSFRNPFIDSSRHYHWNSLQDVFRKLFRDSLSGIFRHFIGNSSIDSFRNYFTDYSRDCNRDFLWVLPGISLESGDSLSPSPGNLYSQNSSIDSSKDFFIYFTQVSFIDSHQG